MKKANKTKKFNYDSFNNYLLMKEKEEELKEIERKKEEELKRKAEENKPKKIVEIPEKKIEKSTTSFFDNFFKEVDKKNKPVDESKIVVIPYISPEEQEKIEQKKKEEKEEEIRTVLKLQYELPKTENILYLSCVKKEIRKDNTVKSKKTIAKFPVRKVNQKVEQIPEFFACYANALVLQLSFTALHTIYGKSANNMVLKLIRDLCRIWKYNTTTAENFEEYVIAKNKCKELMQKKIHKYKIGKIKTKDNKFKRVRIEIIPYETLEYSKTGKEIMQEKQFQLLSDVNDVLLTGIVAYCELYQLGFIHQYADLYKHRNYIYKCIDSYVNGQKRNKDNNNESLEEIIEYHGEKADFYSSSAENCFLHLKTEKAIEKIEENETINSFRAFLMENFKTVRKAQEKKKSIIVDSWIENKINNKTQQQIAIMFDEKQQQISRFISYIDEFIISNNEIVLDWIDESYNIDFRKLTAVCV